MDFVLQPWQLLDTIIAGWINRQQQEFIDYLGTHPFDRYYCSALRE